MNKNHLYEKLRTSRRFFMLCCEAIWANPDPPYGGYINKKTIIFFVALCFVLILPMKFYFANTHKFTFSVFNINSAFAKDKKAVTGTGNKKELNPGEKNKNNGNNTKTKPCPDCPKCPDPAKMVFNGLEQKRVSIAKAEAKLKKMKKSLEVFKGDLDDKLDSLSKLKKQIETDLANIEKKKTAKQQQKQAAFEAKMDRLVKMYSGMKPRNAAKIVDQLDLEVAKEIFSRMRETSAAQILAYVNSEKAAKISERIAYKNK